MVEHVGYKNYSRLFHQIHDHLSDDGLYLLHTIGTNRTNKTGDPFLVKYIFPNGMAPSFRQIDSARQGLFSLRDVHCLTSHYSPTLLSWNKNFQSNWDGIAAQYDERFRRMFEYYLLMCAGAFRADQLQLWQMVFSKEGHVVDYTGVR
jgi:cyclopropane-fatty-acyl-phospholipid synthase